MLFLSLGKTCKQVKAIIFQQDISLTDARLNLLHIGDYDGISGQREMSSLGLFGVISYSVDLTMLCRDHWRWSSCYTLTDTIINTCCNYLLTLSTKSQHWDAICIWKNFLAEENGKFIPPRDCHGGVRPSDTRNRASVPAGVFIREYSSFSVEVVKCILGWIGF